MACSNNVFEQNPPGMRQATLIKYFVYLPITTEPYIINSNALAGPPAKRQKTLTEYAPGHRPSGRPIDESHACGNDAGTLTRPPDPGQTVLHNFWLTEAEQTVLDWEIYNDRRWRWRHSRHST